MKIIQGDIIFVKVDSIPKGKEKKDGIIAEGEISGHFHKLIKTDVKEGAKLESMTDGLLVEAPDGKLYVQAGQYTQVGHNEHKTVVLPEGNWEVKRTREYSPRGWHEVLD